ncbi:GvpL/GvpF family gas vesicle protein [Streptomyces sp. NPDC057582]|uniref:GvpL/GvpF family gas vesicle protein n=1 Tax=Streptomyces sp. NPDC057582 TaxID=3346174 RepID=UPI003681C913
MARAVAAGPDAQGCMFNVSFLVNRGASDDFRSAAERFGSAHREHVELRLAGPLSWYNFVAAAGTHVPAESDMGLITGLLTVPVAPVRAVIWVVEAQRRCRARGARPRSAPCPAGCTEPGA